MLHNRLGKENMASKLVFYAILDRLASEIQHYVNKMSDNWICKEMMDGI